MKDTKRKEELLSWWQELEVAEVSNSTKVFIIISIVCVVACLVAKYVIRMSIADEIYAAQLSLTVNTITIAVICISSIAGYVGIIRRARIMHKKTVDTQRSIIELLKQSQKDIAKTVGQSEQLVVRASKQLYDIVTDTMSALMAEKEGFWRSCFEDFDAFDEDRKDEDLEMISLDGVKPDDNDALARMMVEMEGMFRNVPQPDAAQNKEVVEQATEEASLQHETPVEEPQVDDNTRELPDINRMPENTRRLLTREQLNTNTRDLNVLAVKEALVGSKQPAAEAEVPVQEPKQKVCRPIAEQAAELGVDEDLLTYCLKSASPPCNDYTELPESELQMLRQNAEYEKMHNPAGRRVS